MYELKDDPVYEVLKQYPDICVDYRVMRDTDEYHGISSQRDAVGFAMKVFAEECEWEYDLDKAAMVSKIEPADFFAMPGDRPVRRRKRR